MHIDTSSSVLTVSQITTEIKLMLESKHRFVAVSGEISNLKTPFSGHHYFTLKDNNAQLRAVMFKGQRRYLREELRNGQQVICRGRISVYEPRGEYQIIIDTVDQHGTGILQMKFAALKQKLQDEGLFEGSKKKQLPDFPQNIVIITSPTGAAIQDFLKICRQRSTNSHIQIYPVAVQGTEASPSIAQAIRRVNEEVECDLIVLCRGGGSIEDLWAFNEEQVARAISGSIIPIITGIGHETDSTIADFCADMRAPTPTGAAEIVIQDSRLLQLQIKNSIQRLKRVMALYLSHNSSAVMQQLRFLTQHTTLVDTVSLRLDPLVERLQRVGIRLVSSRNEQLKRVATRLEYQAPLSKIDYQSQTVTHLQKLLQSQIAQLLQHREERLGRAATLLQGVSPLSTLSRGYSIVQIEDIISGELQTVSDSNQVNSGDSVNILLHKGRLVCEVQGKEEQ